MTPNPIIETFGVPDDVKDAVNNFNNAILRSTGHIAPRKAEQLKGAKIYARGKTMAGTVRCVSYRHCAACGQHSCYIVDWPDGHMTKPCTAGVKTNPDGTLEIE